MSGGQHREGNVEDSDVRERVTVSSVPVSQEGRVSVTRRLAVEPAWLDHLLLATCEMPVRDGEGPVVECLVRACGEILGNAAVGACLAEPAAGSGHTLGGEQRIFKCIPSGEEARAIGVDPTRLFPGYAYERALPVEATGTTLHVASDDPAIEADDGPTMHVMRRAGLAMARGLAFARAHAKARADSEHLLKLNAHMVQAEKLAVLGQLAAGVVHELNNPLTAIVAYTDYLLKRHENGDPSDLERLTRIGESAARILRFTRDLVAYARPSSETPTRVPIELVVERSLAFCEHVLAAAGARVERAFEEGVHPVRGMSEELAQVFVNLFTNACHALPAEGGMLRVAIASRGAEVVVTLDDNGHGIAPEHIPQIFTPFFTTKTDGRGTGLGLSIVKSIIDRHDGQLLVERLSPGTRFTLVLPRWE